MGTPLNGEISLFFISQFLTPKWVPVHPALFEKRKLIVRVFCFRQKRASGKLQFLKSAFVFLPWGSFAPLLNSRPLHTLRPPCVSRKANSSSSFSPDRSWSSRFGICFVASVCLCSEGFFPPALIPAMIIITTISPSSRTQGTG